MTMKASPIYWTMCVFSFAFGFLLGLVICNVSNAQSHDQVREWGYEYCEGSERFNDCVDWFESCYGWRMVQAGPWSSESAAEYCAENMPAWATRGM